MMIELLCCIEMFSHAHYLQKLVLTMSILSFKLNILLILSMFI